MGRNADPDQTSLEEGGGLPCAGKTCAHSWPHALENRQIYQTKGIESSGIGPVMLGRFCCQAREGPASCSWTPALCTMQRPSRRVTMRRLDERGRSTSRVSNRVRFPPQVSGAQAKATVCRTKVNTNTHTHIHTQALLPPQSASVGVLARGWKANRAPALDTVRQREREDGSLSGTAALGPASANLANADANT